MRNSGKTLCWLFPVLLAALLLSGCSYLDGRGENQITTARSFLIYYTNPEGSKLVSKQYTPEAENFEGILKEMLGVFQTPLTEDAVSVLANGVKMNEYQIGVDSLTFDFDASYLTLTNVQEILLRAALVRTFTQLPGIYSVSVTVEHQDITEDDGTVIGPMREDTFIDAQNGSINSVLEADLLLFFPDASDDTGTYLRMEERESFYSSNLLTERFVVEQVIKGPSISGLLPVCSSNVMINSVQKTNGICTVDLSDEFNMVFNTNLQPETILYAFVNSISESCKDVQAVRFRIDGRSDVRFLNEISLESDFTADTDRIRLQEKETSSRETQEDTQKETVLEFNRTEETEDEDGGDE